MRPAYSADYQLPAPAGRWLLPGPAAVPWATPPWPDELTRHQAIYEELLTSPDWASLAAPGNSPPRQRSPSARDLTRDLAGWSLPTPG